MAKPAKPYAVSDLTTYYAISALANAHYGMSKPMEKLKEDVEDAKQTIVSGYARAIRDYSALACCGEIRHATTSQPQSLTAGALCIPMFGAAMNRHQCYEAARARKLDVVKTALIAQTIFNNKLWNPGMGGPKWGRIAQHVSTITTDTIVDAGNWNKSALDNAVKWMEIAVSLTHNGVNFFNKPVDQVILKLDWTTGQVNKFLTWKFSVIDAVAAFPATGYWNSVNGRVRSYYQRYYTIKGWDWKDSWKVESEPLPLSEFVEWGDEVPEVKPVYEVVNGPKVGIIKPSKDEPKAKDEPVIKVIPKKDPVKVAPNIDELIKTASGAQKLSPSVSTVPHGLSPLETFSIKYNLPKAKEPGDYSYSVYLAGKPDSKINAIKVIMAAFDYSLKAAKDVLDAAWDDHAHTPLATGCTPQQAKMLQAMLASYAKVGVNIAPEMKATASVSPGNKIGDTKVEVVVDSTDTLEKLATALKMTAAAADTASGTAVNLAKAHHDATSIKDTTTIPVTKKLAGVYPGYTIPAPEVTYADGILNSHLIKLNNSLLIKGAGTNAKLSHIVEAPTPDELLAIETKAIPALLLAWANQNTKEKEVA